MKMPRLSANPAENSLDFTTTGKYQTPEQDPGQLAHAQKNIAELNEIEEADEDLESEVIQTDKSFNDKMDEIEQQRELENEDDDEEEEEEEEEELEEQEVEEA
mmetsp:Transcript_25764/g.19462  ORF Transcript_25764/g.19462 Transcript_25764/m.19462 type:complete len:103 (+) Transcript_25764:79-387(+)